MEKLPFAVDFLPDDCLSRKETASSFRRSLLRAEGKRRLREMLNGIQRETIMLAAISGDPIAADFIRDNCDVKYWQHRGKVIIGEQTS